MNKLLSYAIGMLAAAVLWVGVGQTLIYHYVNKYADQAAYERFEKNSTENSAPKAQIEKHYREAEEFAHMLSIIGALITGFIAGVLVCKLNERYQRSQKPSKELDEK
jgi:hypothetical protein